MAIDSIKNNALKPSEILKHINKSWTLFLDRDGVINNELLGEYVLNWEGFVFSTGVLEAIRELSNIFGKIIIITNQRGVGRKLMTEADLLDIHDKMLQEIKATGGRINHIYYCIEDDEQCFNRKPSPGMALEAFKQYPDIDPAKTIMVGNKPSDMRFGRASGIFTVFLATTNPEVPFPHPDIDLRFNNLGEFTNAIKELG